MAYFNINRVETGNRIVKRRKEMNLSSCVGYSVAAFAS